MKQVKTMPKKGQFIIVWEYNGQLWSSTFCWQNTLKEYSVESDRWIDASLPNDSIKETYFILEEN